MKTLLLLLNSSDAETSVGTQESSLTFSEGISSSNQQVIPNSALGLFHGTHKSPNSTPILSRSPNFEPHPSVTPKLGLDSTSTSPSKSIEESNIINSSFIAAVKHIYFTFIVPGSAFQINISYRHQLKITEQITSNTIKETIFDEAKKEVEDMLSYNIIPNFIKWRNHL